MNRKEFIEAILNFQDSASTDERLNLLIEIEKTEYKLEEIYDRGFKEDYYDQLFRIAKNSFDESFATKRLEAFKEKIVLKDGDGLNNKRIKYFGLEAIKLSTIALVLYNVLLILSFLPFENCQFLSGLSNLKTLYAEFNLLILFVGSMVGIWFSFVLRKQTLRFDDLISFDEDRMMPRVRLLFTGLLSTFVGLVFITKIIDIKVSDLSVDDFLGNSHGGLKFLLLGVVLGLNDLLLGKFIQNKTSQFFGPNSNNNSQQKTDRRTTNIPTEAQTEVPAESVYTAERGVQNNRSFQEETKKEDDNTKEDEPKSNAIKKYANILWCNLRKYANASWCYFKKYANVFLCVFFVALVVLSICLTAISKKYAIQPTTTYQPVTYCNSYINQNDSLVVEGISNKYPPSKFFLKIESDETQIFADFLPINSKGEFNKSILISKDTPQLFQITLNELVASNDSIKEIVIHNQKHSFSEK
jgi:hypothetical protein